jgi:hypothetical protein
MTAYHTTKEESPAPSRNRWTKLLATRQPNDVFDAFRNIARRRKTTVSAMLGEAVIEIIAKAREELPKRLQQRLHELNAERPPMGRPRSKLPQTIKPKQKAVQTEYNGEQGRVPAKRRGRVLHGFACDNPFRRRPAGYPR